MFSINYNNINDTNSTVIITIITIIAIINIKWILTLALWQLSSDRFLTCARSNTIAWWEKWLTTIASHDMASPPTNIVPTNIAWAGESLGTPYGPGNSTLLN